MQVRITARLDSAVFKQPALKQAIASFIVRQAKDFKDLTKRRMIDSQPSGRLYRRKRGAAFTRAHRASARGQRPAIDTGKLLNSINDRRAGEYSRMVSADAEYAGYLQSERLDRPIMNDRDAAEAQVKAVREGNDLASKFGRMT